MTSLENAATTVFGQAIRLIQLVGIPLMGFLLVLGLIILLTSGKNPRRKRAGMIMTIGFSIGVFVISYVPLLAYRYGGDRPREATGNETVNNMVDSSAGFGSSLFTGLKYGSIPLVFTMFYVGMIIILTASKSPQKKRLGLGIMLLSPLVLTVVFILPKLLPML